MSREHARGFAPIAVLALGFLVTSLITVTIVTNNPVKNFAITSWAKVKPKTWRDIGGPSAGRHAGKLAAEQAARDEIAASAALKSQCEADKAAGKGNYICDTPGGLQEYNITQPQEAFQEAIIPGTPSEGNETPSETQTAPNPFETFGGSNPELTSEQKTLTTITQPPTISYEKTDDGFIKTETTITRLVNPDGTVGDVVTAKSVRTQTKVNTAIKAYQDSLTTWHYVREDTTITTNVDTGDVVDAKTFTYPLSRDEISKLSSGQPIGTPSVPIAASIEDYKAVATRNATSDQLSKIIEQCGKYCDNNRDLETFALTLLQQSAPAQYPEAQKIHDENLASDLAPQKSQTALVDVFGRAITGPGGAKADTTFTTTTSVYEDTIIPFVMRITDTIITRDSSGKIISQKTTVRGALINRSKLGTTETATTSETPGQPKITILPSVSKPLSSLQPVSVPASTVPYKGYIAPSQAPKDLQTVAYLTDLFNSVMKDQGIPDMNDYEAKAAFIAEVKKRLIATGNPQLIGLASSKAFTDYFAGDRVAKSELFGFYQENIGKHQLINCNQWAIGVALMFPDLHIVADQYPFQNGGIFSNTGDFSSSETKSLTPGCNSTIGDALSKCSGKLKFGISGDVAAYRFTDYGSINKGDSFVYGKHFGVILDKYQVNGKYYFMVTEANSPKGNLDGQPQTYLVSQDDFAARVNDLSKTYFLRLNKYDQGTTTPTSTTPGVLAEIRSYSSQQVNPSVAIQAPVASVPLPSTANISGGFAYFSQKDTSWAEGTGIKPNVWSLASCAINAGAMVSVGDPSISNPRDYYLKFRDYFNGRRLTKKGTAFDDHRTFLESRGRTFIPVEGSLQDIKRQIKNYSAEGIPVWVAAYIETGENTRRWVGHDTVAIGVNAAGEILFNDPWYGENVPISDDRIVMGEENGLPGWRVFAVK